MAFKRKVAKANAEDAKAALETKPEPSDVPPSDAPPVDQKPAAGWVKSLFTPLNVILLALILINVVIRGGEDDDSKTNLREGVKKLDAKAIETPKDAAPEDAAPAPPEFTGVTGKLLDSDAIESVLNNSTRTNIALKKPAAQSSDYNTEWLGGNAVDGNRSGDIVSHTNWECGAWWQVDLQGIHSVEDIIIYNRGGYAPITARLADFLVEVLTLNGESWDTTGKYHSVGAAGLREGYHFEPGAEGSVVRIRLSECEVLHMEQVEVYGTPV